jgi:hypothetical protein
VDQQVWLGFELEDRLAELFRSVNFGEGGVLLVRAGQVADQGVEVFFHGLPVAAADPLVEFVELRISGVSM